VIQTFTTPEALADAVARHIVACAADAISSRGRFTLALAGGSTPRAAYSRLASGDSPPTPDSRLPTLWGLATDDWGLVHILWGDERCVPPDDPQSNYRMAKETLLDRVPIPSENIHRIRGEDDPEQAAMEYERELRALFAAGHSERSEESAESHIDVVLLGLGEDGHTASLFPGQPALHETERWVVAVPAPTGNMWRVTLTPAVLNRARNVTFVVSGAGKAQRLEQVLHGPFTPDLLPAQAIRPGQGRLTWMVDEAAAGKTTAHHGDTENTETARKLREITAPGNCGQKHTGR
jgi:6-phosphogluconolactonase